ncbi:MAG: efflux transporter outer membrane subunit [Candidatus Latescibacteria bacterium]|nr:efflux transporter outer membrane subunit [Candidatus Latescibacterota bacterium]
MTAKNHLPKMRKKIMGSTPVYNAVYALCTLHFALIIGCASAPRIQKTGIQTPPNWQTKTSTTAPADTLWWATFNDTYLDSLVTKALAQNYSLKAAASRLKAAQAQAKIAGAPLYPQIGAGFSGSKRKQNFIGFPLPGQAGDEIASTISTTYGVSVNASWEIDLWGRLSAGQSAALASYQASQATYRGTRMSLAAQTAKAYFAAIEAKRQLELAQATYKDNQTSNAQVRIRYERGVRPSLDMRSSESSLASSKDRLHQREQLYDIAVRQLEILLGGYPSGKLTITGGLPQIPEPVPAGLPADIIARRPDLVTAERRLAATQANHKAAKRARYPRISLTASSGRSTNVLGDLLNGDYSVWSLVTNLTQPLFQGGRIRGNIDLTKAQANEATANFAQAALQAYAEVENTLSAEQYLAKRQEALEVATEQASEARRLAEDRYNRGLTDLITMLQTRSTAYITESQLLSVLRQRLNARIDLHLALGGGFPDRATLLSSSRPTGENRQ